MPPCLWNTLLPHIWVGSQARGPACVTRTQGRGAEVRTGISKQRSEKQWEGIGQGCQGWEEPGVLENELSLVGAEKRSETVFVRNSGTKHKHGVAGQPKQSQAPACVEAGAVPEWRAVGGFREAQVMPPVLQGCIKDPKRANVKPFPDAPALALLAVRKEGSSQSPPLHG